MGKRGRKARELIYIVADKKFYGHGIEKIALMHGISIEEANSLIEKAKEIGYQTSTNERSQLGKVIKLYIKKMEQVAGEKLEEKSLDDLLKQLSIEKENKAKIAEEIFEKVKKLIKKEKEKPRIYSEITEELKIKRKTVISRLGLARKEFLIEMNEAQMWELALILYDVLKIPDQEIADIMQIEKNSIPGYIKYARLQGVKVENRRIPREKTEVEKVQKPKVIKRKAPKPGTKTARTGVLKKQGLSTEEIAVKLDSTPNAVRDYLRTLKKIGESKAVPSNEKKRPIADGWSEIEKEMKSNLGFSEQKKTRFPKTMGSTKKKPKKALPPNPNPLKKPFCFKSLDEIDIAKNPHAWALANRLRIQKVEEKQILEQVNLVFNSYSNWRI